MREENRDDVPVQSTPAESIQRLTRDINVDPENPRMSGNYLARATAHIRNRDRTAAVVDLEKAKAMFEAQNDIVRAELATDLIEALSRSN